ncbi:MAG: helix-hairpin-helix domain-containing protein [Acidobacteria bacterium]|nr:helix-hairpin-helix domain-containing protein [Acidobacteriota bacterium]
MKKVFGMTMVIALAMVLGSFTPAQAAPKKAHKKINTVQQHTQIININKASVDQLTTLKGIGLKKAQAIVAFRTQNGNFKKVEDIMLVKGIGQKLFDKMKPFITVK